MSLPCETQLLSAYVDGELSSLDRCYVEEHVQHCVTCARELEQLRQASLALREYAFDEIDDDERERLHLAIEEVAQERSVWRLGMVLSAMAASILIVSSAWLMEIPAHTGSASPSLAQRTASPPAEWERIAMTLRADPLPAQDDAVQLADADLADWMLQGLARGR